MGLLCIWAHSPLLYGPIAFLSRNEHGIYGAYSMPPRHLGFGLRRRIDNKARSARCVSLRMGNRAWSSPLPTILDSTLHASGRPCVRQLRYFTEITSIACSIYSIITFNLTESNLIFMCGNMKRNLGKIETMTLHSMPCLYS